jgi:hypothetical protein
VLLHADIAGMITLLACGSKVFYYAELRLSLCERKTKFSGKVTHGAVMSNGTLFHFRNYSMACAPTAAQVVVA